MNNIAYQNKDIASKMMGDALVGKSLAAFGLPDLHVVGVLPTNLPAIESNELRLDHLFLLNDGSLAIIDYESDYDKKNFSKYLSYIARVIKRYVQQNRQDELVQIKMVVIYTADVEKAEQVYDLGGVVLNVEAAFLVEQDTDDIYKALRTKIERKETLTDEDLMQLMILPLTVKGSEQKQHMIEKTVDLTKQMGDRDQIMRVLAGILTFTDKVIDKEYKDKLKEEMRMTQIAWEFIQEGYEEGYGKGYGKGYGNGLCYMAKKMYEEGISLEKIAEMAGEELTVIREWLQL